MKKRIEVGFCIGVIALLVSFRTTPAQDEKPLKGQLLGTWECISPETPKGVTQIKHVTPTHFTWITYDRNNKTVLASAGGTWFVRQGTYTEHIEFASDSHKFLRGGKYSYTVKVKGDEWTIASSPESDIQIREVWKRAR